MEAYKRARLIDGVTADDDKVAPVYKLDEICTLLEESTPDVVKEVSDYLLQRLDRGSPFVKQKALRVIKFAVPKAGREFRRYIQRRASEIKSYFHYRGHPDPLRGDAPNKAVREMAHEAVQAIFTQPEEARSTAAAAPGPMENAPRKRMEGFGNTPVNPPGKQGSSGPGQQGIGDILGKGVAMFTGPPGGAGGSRRAYEVEEEQNSRGSYVGPQAYGAGRYDERGYGGAPGRSSYGDEYGHNDYDGHDFRSPRDRDYSDGPHGRSSYGNDSYGDRREVAHDRREAASEEGRVSAGSGMQGSPEEKAVEAVAAHGGVRLQPTREALRDFVAGLSRLHAGRVAQALENRLHSPAWQVRLRALCALEAVLRTQGDRACDEVFAFFVDGPQAVTACLEHPQASVAEKAKRVLDVLGLGHADPSPSAARQQAASAVPDLIDITESSDSTGATEAGSAPTDLLGALSPGESTAGATQAVAHAAGTADFLGSISAPAATQPAPVSAATDLLGGLSLDGAAAGPAPSPAAGRAPRAAAPGDIFGSVELLSPTNDAASPAGAAGGGGGADLFSGLEVNDDSGVSAVKSMLQQPAVGSAASLGVFGGSMAAQGAGLGAVHSVPGMYPMHAAAVPPGRLGAPVGVNPMMAAPQFWPGVGAVPLAHGMHSAASVPGNPAVSFPHPSAMHAAAYGSVPTAGAMAMGIGSHVPHAWHAAAAGGVGHGVGGGIAMGATGFGGPAAGRGPLDFDFSGDASVKMPPQKSAAETTKAFDFVAEQMAAIKSSKVTSTFS